MNNELHINMLIKATDTDQLYRLLWLSDDRNIAYIFNTTTMEMPTSMLCSELRSGIENGLFSIKQDDPYVTAVSESVLTDKEKDIRDNVWALMESIVKNEPGIYIKKERGQILAEVINGTGKQLVVLHRYLKTYWQSGKTKNAFVPRYNNCGAAGKDRVAGVNKRGRPSQYGSTNINVDAAIRAAFEKAIKKYYLNRNEHTLQYAYDMMIAENYTKYITGPDGKTKAVMASVEQLPTIRQFRYWFHKTHDDKEKITKRKGESKFNLDHRAITGKSDYGLMGPGSRYEIDATIGDIYLLSRFNRADIIGRPVIYFVLDAFSRMVTGMYVGLEGPSWSGMMMAIANAVSDKVKYCAEYGIEITEEEWPCRGVPGVIRGDRGELESKSADTLVNALNVRVEVAPPYRADMKGIVEQHFNTINGTTVARLPGHVLPDMKERGGHDYRHDAKFDIHQFTKIIIQSVLGHNNHHFLESYERTADMIADNIMPIPIDLWNWGVAHAGALRTFPEEAVKLALMPADTATVTGKGIRFKSLYYLCGRAASEHWFETARSKKSWKVNISYDPRNMGAIYIRNADGSVESCWLSNWQDKYIGKHLHEINYLHGMEKMMQRGNTSKEMTSRAELSAAIDDVIAEAEAMARQTVVAKSKSERTKNIRTNRSFEKEENRKNEAFVLGDADNQPPGVTPTIQKEEISPDMRMILEDLEARLNEE
jgi:hypothetical protein